MVTLAEWVKRFFEALHRRRKEAIFLRQVAYRNGNVSTHVDETVLEHVGKVRLQPPKHVRTH